MTEQKANQIFKTKYPEGEIVRRNNSSAGNKFWVTFKPDGKVYYYSCATYKQLLQKLGFEVVYQHNIEAEENLIAMAEKDLEEIESGKGNIFSIALGITLEEQKEECLKELEERRSRLNYFKTECIILEG